MAQDEIQIEVLEDGTVRMVTDQVSAANHQSADKFLEVLAQYMGGDVDKVARKKGHAHTHEKERAKEKA